MFYEKEIDCSDINVARDGLPEAKEACAYAYSFSMQAIDSRTGRIKAEIPEQHNLLLNQGLNYICTNSVDAATAYLQVGTSQNTPQVTDTALGSYLAGIAINLSHATPVYVAASGTFGQPGYVPPHIVLTATVTFATGAVVGNVAELGLSRQQATGGLTTRALVTDASGNPTTLTLLSTDQLRVTYSMSVFMDMNTYTFTNVTLGEWTGDITICAASVSSTITNWYTGGYVYASGQRGGLAFFNGRADLMDKIWYGTGALGTPGNDPTGTSAASGATYAADAYVNNSYQNRATLTSSTSADNQSFYALTMSVGGSPWLWKCGFSPVIPKTNLQSFNFAISFSIARYVPA